MSVTKASRLGPQEYLSLIALVISTQVFYNTPRSYFLVGANAAWLSVVCSLCAALLVFAVIGLFLERNPGKSLYEAACQTIGAVGGGAVILALSGYWALNAAMTVRLLGEAIVMTALPSIPISVVIVVTLGFSLYAGLRGWNALAKTAWVSIPFLAVGVLVPLLLTAGHWTPALLFPLLGAGARATLLGGTATVGVWGEVILAAVLAGMLQPGVRPLRAGISALILCGVLLLIVVIAVSMVFPFPIASQLTSPYYSLSRALSFGRFLQRLEALTLLIWAFASLLKVAVMVKATVTTFCQVFAIRDQDPLMAPAISLVFALAVLPGSFAATSNLLWQGVLVYGGIPSLVIPALVAVIGLARARAAAGKGRQT
jgi:spore germination protein KB